MAKSLTRCLQSGAIQESLRLSHGPAVRLPRVSTEKALEYGDHVIPPGVSFSRDLW